MEEEHIIPEYDTQIKDTDDENVYDDNTYGDNSDGAKSIQIHNDEIIEEANASNGDRYTIVRRKGRDKCGAMDRANDEIMEMIVCSGCTEDEIRGKTIHITLEPESLDLSKAPAWKRQQVGGFFLRAMKRRVAENPDIIKKCWQPEDEFIERWNK